MRALVLQTAGARLIPEGAAGPLRSHVRLAFTVNNFKHGGALGLVVNRWANEWVRATDLHLHLIVGTLSIRLSRALLPWLQ